MNEQKVALIIINFNGKQHLATCLDSIYNQTYKNFSVTIVDNNSTDGSVRFIKYHSIIKKKYPNIELIENKRNVGFGKAINQVLKEKLEDNDFEFFGILNNDIRLDNKWLKNLIIYSRKNPKAGILGGKVLLYHWPKYINSTGVNINYLGYGWDRDFFELDKKCNRKSGPVLAVTGCATLIKAEVLRQIGLYDHDYFMYYEDCDLCIRTWKYTEFSVDYVRDAIIYHKFSASVGAFSGNKHFHIERSRFIFIFKNFPLFFVIKIFPKIISLEFVNTIWLLIKRLSFIVLFIRLLSYSMFLSRFPFIIIKKLFNRKKAKKNEWWKMLYPTYTRSDIKNIDPDFMDIKKYDWWEMLYPTYTRSDIKDIDTELENIKKYGTMSNKILMGINDADIGSGWSNIINSIPRGRYLFNKGNCKLVVNYIENKHYYLQIHYNNYENQGKKLKVSADTFSITFKLNYGWNTKFIKLPDSLLKDKVLNINLELVNEGYIFEDLFINEISVLAENSNLLRLI